MAGRRRQNSDIRKEAVQQAAKNHPPKRQRKPRGTAGVRNRIGVQCGAKKRAGGKCTLAAGWGTSHPGSGACKFHGGAAPNHVKAAAKNELRKLLGVEKEMNPFEAIMWCIRIRAGEVEWLSKKLADLEEKHWVEDTLVGKQFHLYARERQAAMGDLVRFSQIAISMGIAERYVRLAEVYGHTIAKLIEGVLNELGLTEEQRRLAPAAIRKQLLLMEGSNVLQEDIIEGKAKEIPERSAA
jgi:hypothetical protein